VRELGRLDDHLAACHMPPAADLSEAFAALD
jgi:hypothetical protein